MNPAVQVFVVAIVGGVVALWASRVLRLPAIVPLLLLGTVLGPQLLGLLPRPSAVIPGAFSALVEVGVAIILFDGGLSLNLRDVRSAPKVVRNLLTIGAGVTFAGGILCARYLAGFDLAASVLFGSLVIVTGPTVIVPLLQNVHLTRRLHTVLLWEGILIDAIGALTGVMAMEIVMGGKGMFEAGGQFAGSLLLGPAIGAAGGWLLALWLRNRTARGHTEDELNYFVALAGALVVFGIGEVAFRSCGLAAVTCAGLVVSNMLGRTANDLRRAKGTVTRFIVSILFILLASDFDLKTLLPLWPGGFIAVAALMLVVRPLNVLVSSHRSRLSWKERVFLGCTAPRGIVAASVASLFGMILQEHGQAQMGQQLVAITFLAIMMTVLFSGLAAYPLAKTLGLVVRSPQGILVVGANRLAQELAGLYEARDIPVLMIDTNPLLCDEARRAGFRAIEGNAFDGDFLAKQDLAGIGMVVAMTPSARVNTASAVQTARLLNLGAAYAVDCGSPPEELEMLKSAGVHLILANRVDVDAVCDLIAAGKAKLRNLQFPLSPDAARHGKVFLPLTCIDGQEIRPYSLDERGQAEEIIGLEFGTPDPLPFAPYWGSHEKLS